MVLANGGQQVPGLLSVSSEGVTIQQGIPVNPGSQIHSNVIDPDNEDVPMIDKAQAVERLKQARKRRAQQLKKWNQYEKQLEKDAQKKKKLIASTAALQPDADASSRSRRVQFSQNLLLLEAASRGDLDEVAALLARGISPDSANEDGLTALHQCCIDDNEAMCRLLLQYHANMDSVDSELWTPLHAAATCGHANICKVLIEHGANLVAVNADGNMAYDICEDEYTLSYIESEMAKRGITQEQIDEMRGERERQTLVDLKQWVADGGDVDVVVDPRSGATMLHVAAANGWVLVCEYLLSQGALVDVDDRDGWQPVHVAACWGYIDEVQLLIENGADPDARTRGGESIFELCEDEELRRRMHEIKNDAERRTRVQRPRPSPALQNNHRVASPGPAQPNGNANAADAAPKVTESITTSLSVTNAASSSPNLSASRANGSIRLRSSFSHGSPAANGNAIGNSNRSSIRRSSMRRASMRQKSMMPQREAEADGELRQQAAEALAVSGGSGVLFDADSVDDLDSDPTASAQARNAQSATKPASSPGNSNVHLASHSATFTSDKYVRTNTPVDLKYLESSSLSNGAAVDAASASGQQASVKGGTTQPSIEKKSALKSTNNPSSSQTANRAGNTSEAADVSNPGEQKAPKGSNKGCCVVS